MIKNGGQILGYLIKGISMMNSLPVTETYGMMAWNACNSRADNFLIFEDLWLLLILISNISTANSFIKQGQIVTWLTRWVDGTPTTEVTPVTIW